MNSPVAASTPKRTYEIWGNWKMNPMTLNEAQQLAKDTFDEYSKQIIPDNPSSIHLGVGLFVPLAFASHVGEVLHDGVDNAAVPPNFFGLGAQTMHYKESGALTGEHSPTMIKSLFTSLGLIPTVLIGHSERRQMFGETDICVNKKMHAAYEYGVRPFMAIGETLEERETGSTNSVLERQLRMGLEDVPAMAFASAKTVIAYEPVWAIGTGKTATPEIANDAHAHIRSVLADMFTQGIADQASIQYGGSMKPENAASILAMEHIDGGLIGGAALSAQSFINIVSKIPPEINAQQSIRRSNDRE